MKNVDALAQNMVGIKGRPNLAELRGMVAQQLHRGLVDIGDDEIAVHHHHRRGDVIDRTLQA